MNYGRLEHLPLWKLEMMREQQTRKVEQLETATRNARRELEALEAVTKLRRGTTFSKNRPEDASGLRFTKSEVLHAALGARGAIAATFDEIDVGKFAKP